MSYILVVDDDQSVRMMLMQTLMRAGYVVKDAENGDVALDKVHEEYPGLVITDLIMPQKEGIETIYTLRKEYPTLPIIAMSGGGRLQAENYLPLAEKMGVNGTLKKPFNRETFLGLVAQVLEQAKQTS